MSLKKSIIRVNEDEQLLSKLRRLHVVEKDEHGEFVWAQIGGDFIGKGEDSGIFEGSKFKMYLGNEVEVPETFANKLLAGYPVPLDEPCPQCWNEKLNKSTGFTVAGICHQCRGTKFIDLNRTVNTFQLVKTTAGDEVFDPANLPVPKKKREPAAARA